MSRVNLALLAATASAVIVMSGAERTEASSRLEGMASYYSYGRYTANGERFNPNALTAAHRTLPFGTKVRVTHRKSGRSVVVRINDRGPFAKRRIIDVSRGAARALGMTQAGVARVTLEVID